MNSPQRNKYQAGLRVSMIAVGSLALSAAVLVNPAWASGAEHSVTHSMQRGTLSISSERVAGDRLRVSVVTSAHTVLIRSGDAAGQRHVSRLTVHSGTASKTLPARTTTLQVRCPASSWITVSVPARS